jgi:general bacterial porin, GBP family
MKKTLLAAALIAGYAGAASAQNSVTLYGVVDIGLNYTALKGGSAPPAANLTSNTANQFGLASGVQSGSRWGLKGVEDLGNGLKANFVYESGVDATNGSGNNGFTRQATLGLVSSSWGAIDLGRRTAPSTQQFAGIDPFAAGFGQASLTNAIGTNFYRLSNMAMYTTPNISGFSGAVGYSFDTGLSGTPAASTSSQFGQANKSRAVSLGLRYANGPLLLAATYDNIQANSRSTGAYVNPGAYKTWALGGTFDLKIVKLHAAFAQANDGLLNNFTGITSITTGGDTNANSAINFIPGARTTSWMAGLSAPVGTGNAFLSIQQKIKGGTLSDVAIPTANEFGAQIGYTYPFSKRTNMYASYSYLNNAAMVQGASSNAINLGIRHLF